MSGNPQTTVLSPGAKVAGKYEVVDVVGFGGMGIVYKVRERVGGSTRIRALKTVLPQFAANPTVIARFRHEAERMCMVEHENIVPVMSYGEEGAFPYLVMPFIDGCTLRDYLSAHLRERGTGLPLDEVVEIGLQLASGLEMAHGFVNRETGKPQPVIHRDIKPGNVMIRVQERGGERRLNVLITDFGIAKMLFDENPENSNSGLVGTARYAAPEQVGRTAEVDARADIYSLGMLLYEIHAGRHVFADLTENGILLRLLRRDAASSLATFPEATPAGLRQLILRCIDFDRERRFSAVGELKPILRGILEEESERIAEDVRRLREVVSRRREVALAAGAAELAADALETADARLASASEHGSSPWAAVRGLEAAAAAYETAALEAATDRERKRLLRRLEVLAELQASAAAAGALELAAAEVTTAEQLASEARRALIDGRFSDCEEAVARGTRAWLRAESRATREALRRDAQQTIEEAWEALEGEAAVYGDRKTGVLELGPLESLAKARGLFSEAERAFDAGDYEEALDAAASIIAAAKAAGRWEPLAARGVHPSDRRRAGSGPPPGMVVTIGTVAAVVAALVYWIMVS